MWCHLCNEQEAVMSDNVCSDCAVKYPFRNKRIVEETPCPKCIELEKELLTAKQEAVHYLERKGFYSKKYNALKAKVAEVVNKMKGIPKVARSGAVYPEYDQGMYDAYQIIIKLLEEI